MSEDDGHESGCDTVEGSPSSDTSTSRRGNSAYRYLNNNNRSPLAAVLAPLTPPSEQDQRPRGIRTMVVPPMRLHSNNNTRNTQERFHRAGQWTNMSSSRFSYIFWLALLWKCLCSNPPRNIFSLLTTNLPSSHHRPCGVACALAASNGRRRALPPPSGS